MIPELETLLNVAAMMVYALWWLPLLFALVALTVWIQERSEAPDPEPWPFPFDEPFNMDEESA